MKRAACSAGTRRGGVHDHRADLMRAPSVRTYPDRSYRSHATEERLWSLVVRACQRVRGGSSYPEAGPSDKGDRLCARTGFLTSRTILCPPADGRWPQWALLRRLRRLRRGSTPI